MIVTPIAQRWPGRVSFALSGAGYVVAAIILFWGFTSGKFSIPGGDALIWDRVGDEIRNGVSPYYPVSGSGGFYYAPPWALWFALASWLPVQVTAILMTALEIAALRYIAGSWLRVGHCLCLPLVAFELPSSQVNLLMAAAIAAALRGDPRAAVVMAFAKLSPALAIELRDWRRAALLAGVVAAMTVPWAGLWADWAGQLVGSFGQNIGPGATIEIPFLPRLVVALLLVAIRRPWARGLAAIIATPALYWVSWILLLGLLPRPRSRREPARAVRLIETAVVDPAEP